MTTPGNGSSLAIFGPNGPAAGPETAMSAASSRAKSLVEARYTMALMRPRDMLQARHALLQECKRPAFAEKAEYFKPIGGGIRGPSIRLVEVALRAMRNVDVDTTTVFDDEDKRIVAVSVTDLESNTTYTRDVTVTKTVERRQLRDGQEALAQRTNSRGDTVYVVRATDDDILNKEGALVSKAVRTLGLRLIPGDLIDDAIKACKATLEQNDADDPAAAQKRLADGFASINIAPSDLAEYLGHDLSKVTSAELKDLRALYAAIRDGETTWHAAVAAKREPEEGSADAKAAEEHTRKMQARAKAAAEKAKARRQQQEQQAQQAPAAAEETPPAPPQDAPIEPEVEDADDEEPVQDGFDGMP